MKAGSFKNVIPPISVYAGTGQPFKTSLSNLQKNIQQQNELNKTHGGSISKGRFKNKNVERKKSLKGGDPASLDRPADIIIPQAPTNGANPSGPNGGNVIAKGASETLMKHFVNSKFDNDVVLAPIPKSQSGGKAIPLLKRLERLTRKRKYFKSNPKKTRRYKKHYKKKK